MTKIYSYITAKDINPNYQFQGIEQTLEEISTENLFKEIKSRLSELEAKNGVCWLSYLNMWYQWNWNEKCHRISMEELQKLGILKENVDESRMPLHRDIFLYVIAALVMEDHHNGQTLSHQYGNENILGQPALVELLVLMNIWLSRKINEGTYCLQLLRNNPSSYDQRYTADYYFRWIIRYWDIYHDTLEKLEKPKVLIEEGLKLLEVDMKVTLNQYFQVIFGFFKKFLTCAYMLNEYPNLKKNDIQPIATNIFDFNSGRYSGEESLLKLLKSMSEGLLGMRTFMQEECEKEKGKNREFDPVFTHAIKLFHRPVYKACDGLYYIMDFKFLIEGVCSGLLWRLQPLLEEGSAGFKLKDLTCQYGLLLDGYFKKFIKKIFIALSEEGESKPDAVVRSSLGTVIFEFTTECYTIESLYSSKIDKMHAKLDTILFNEGGRKNKQKRSPGKFIILNGYVEKELSLNLASKRIIPVLVTEKYLGDWSLIEKSGYNIKQKIKNLNLEHLQMNPPLIISLDELEIFWRYAPNDKEDAINLFIESIEAWQCDNDKAQYEFSFGRFLEKKLKNFAVNKEYEEFFNPTNLQSR